MCCWSDLYVGRACWLYNIIFSPVLLLIHSFRIYFGGCIWLYSTRLFWLVFGPCMSHYVDKEFPPEASSLGQVSGDAANAEAGRSDSSVVWVRAGDFCRQNVNERPHYPKLFSTDMCLFQGKIEAQDILQGALGDCWLLAAMATLAEHEGAIASRFLTQEVDPRGQYRISLYDPQSKQWRKIIVDDFVPCQRDPRAPDGVMRNRSGMPEALYAHPNGQEIWALVLEKAMAKLCGSYASIEAGITEWGIVCMTGGEAWRFEVTHGGAWVRSDMVVLEDHADKRACAFQPTEESHEQDELFDLLRYYHRHRAVLCCGGVTGAGEAMGLVQKHAFSLLQVRTVRAHWETDKFFRFVQIRNPWGTGEWTGPWSDNSEEWKKYPAVAQALGFTGADDGAYWMQWEDFCQYWTYVGCVDVNWDLNSLRPPMYDERERWGPVQSFFRGCGEFWCLCSGLRHLLLRHDATSDRVALGEYEACCGVDPAGMYCNLLEQKAVHVESGELVVSSHAVQPPSGKSSRSNGSGNKSFGGA